MSDEGIRQACKEKIGLPTILYFKKKMKIWYNKKKRS